MQSKWSRPIKCVLLKALPRLPTGLQVHPLVAPTRVLLYEVVLAPGAQLGNMDQLTVRATGDAGSKGKLAHEVDTCGDCCVER